MLKRVFLIIIISFFLLNSFLLAGKIIFSAEAAGTNRAIIFHFGDFSGRNPDEFFNLLATRYNYYVSTGIRPVIIASGDYSFATIQADLQRFKNALDRFVSQTGCPANDIILAPGNHDDPGRVNTRIWENVFGSSRPVEGVKVVRNLVISWMHTERPNLDFLEQKLAQKLAICPNCIRLMVGHKPLILEPQYSSYSNYLLPSAWRGRVLGILRTYGIKLYLCGHFEVHGTLNNEGVLHNRTTPARRGFEEIMVDYDSASGAVRNINVSVIGYETPIPTIGTPTPTLRLTLTPTPTPRPSFTPTPTLAPSNTCYQPCVSNSDCSSGLVCGYHSSVGRRVCYNLACASETDCRCAWQK